MPHARPLLAAVAALGAIAAAGCGSSGDDHGATTAAKASAPASTSAAPATGSRPTRAAYVRQADAVCRAARDVSRSANTVVSKAFQSGDRAAAAEAIDNYAPLFTRRVDDLKALPRPTGDAKVLTGLIKVMDGQVKALRAESVALRQQDDAALQRIGTVQQKELEFAEVLGKHYGFKVCGRAT